MHYPQRFPRLYAAASLKRFDFAIDQPPCFSFSAALCRGLIEATLKMKPHTIRVVVFRGFMPRPH